MASDGTLIFDTRIDQSGFDNGIESIEQKASTVGDVIAGVLGSQLVQKGVEKLIEAGKYSIQLASDLTEVQNVVDVTFGDGAEAINKFAQTTSKQFGLTELQTKQYAGTLGAMFKSMGKTADEALEMSETMVGLTGDIASFYNLDHEAAFAKIRSGLSGETEPLKQLGINLSVANLEAYALKKGLKATYDQMTEAERVQLRYEYILEQTLDAQGDFTRSQDSYANQIRLLQNNLDTLAASVGGALVPSLTEAVSWLNQLFSMGEKSDTQIAIDDLDDLDNELAKAGNDYVQETVKIQLEYENAQELIDMFEFLQKEAGTVGFGDRTLKIGSIGEDVAALQDVLKGLDLETQIIDELGAYGESTAEAVKEYQTSRGLLIDGIVGKQTTGALKSEDVAALVDVTETLVGTYSELEQYVGENGVLALEAQQVRELTNDYKDLALQKALSTREESIYQAWLDAQVDLALVVQKNKEAQAQLEELETKQKEIVDTSIAVTTAYEQIRIGMRGLTAEDAQAVSDYIRAIGGLDDKVITRLSNWGVDISGIFDNGFLKSWNDIQGAEGGVEALQNLLAVLYSDNDIEKQTITSAVQEAEAEVKRTQEAINEFTPVVEEAEKDYETAKAAVEAFKETLSGAGEESGEGLAKGAASGIESQSSTIESATETICKNAQKTANANPIKIPVETSYRSVVSGILGRGHATGLDYVPYDNYLARLHVGESVLSASDAREWREGRKDADYSAIAAAVEGANSRAVSTPLAFYIDGKELARAQADNNRAALTEASRKIALGVGKE